MTIIFGALLLLGITTTIPLSHHSRFAAAQQQQQQQSIGALYHSNATGATITLHDHSITCKTSNTTGTNNPGITGFGQENSMRNMTNPMFLMKKNPLSNLSNPLALPFVERATIY
ncbi:MAG TPA: hypothetical protein VE076_11330 [Nitrososphaeraceae archaeon]|nr:hypothetical protein [Nitrososphaeraceae archaeon]